MVASIASVRMNSTLTSSQDLFTMRHLYVSISQTAGQLEFEDSARLGGFMKKLGRSTLTLGALSLGVLALGSANAATVIRIASMSPLTGSSSDLGLQIRNATELAIKDNKSAFTALGFDLQFVAYDDQADPTTGTANARRIAAERRAVAVEEARKRQVEADAAIAAAQAAATAEAAAASSLADAAIAAAKVAEAAHALATGKVGVHSRTTGIYGSTSSLQERWVCEIEDDMQVPREHCVASQSSLDRAVAAGARSIPGCRIYPANKLVSR